MKVLKSVCMEMNSARLVASKVRAGDRTFCLRTALLCALEAHPIARWQHGHADGAEALRLGLGNRSDKLAGWYGLRLLPVC